MRLRKNNRIAFLALACAGVLMLSLVSSCGRKGAPTLKTFEKPVPVSQINAVHREDVLILSWGYPSAARSMIKGFFLEKMEEGRTTEFESIAFLKSDVTQFIDKDFKPGRTYLYRIRPVNMRSIPGDYSPIKRVVPKAPPSPPRTLTYTILHDTVELTWNRPEEGVLYNVYKSYEKGKFPASPLNRAPLRENSFKDTVESGRPVYYAVSAQRDTELKDEGPLSQEVEINPSVFVPSAPVGLRYAQAKGRVVLIWDESPEPWVKGYKIYRKRSAESRFVPIGESITPTFIDTEPLTQRTGYAVTALGPKEESALSQSIEVKPLEER